MRAKSVGAWLLAAGLAGSLKAGERELALSTGAFDVGKSGTTAEAGLELRLPPRAWRLVPAVGVAANADSGFWAHAGLRRDFALAPGWWLSPGLALGLYERGDGKDLGHVVEFRSSLELSRETGRRSRLGLAVYHLSNAGLDETNPGSNSLILVWAFRPGGS